MLKFWRLGASKDEWKNKKGGGKKKRAVVRFTEIPKRPSKGGGKMLDNLSPQMPFPFHWQKDRYEGGGGEKKGEKLEGYTYPFNINCS